MGADPHTAARPDAERELLAALMQLPAEPAATVLALVGPHDLACPMAAHVLTLAGELVADGLPPTPVALLGHAEHTGRLTPQAHPHAGTDRRADTRLGDLGAWLAETNATGRAMPAGYARHLAALVIERALRRGVTAYAERLRRHATESTPAALAEALADVAALRELYRRLATARPDDADTTRTPNNEPNNNGGGQLGVAA